MEALSDIDLWRRCRDGDRRAWRAFVRRFGPLVWRVSVRILRSDVEAHDASQETFLRIHRSIATYDPARPLTPWVARIATNVCLRRIERRARTPAPAADETAVDRLVGGAGPDPETAAARGEARERLAAAVDRLDALDRALIVLRYREGLSDAEVAEAAELPLGTVKTRFFRARQRLHAELAGQLAEGT